MTNYRSIGSFVAVFGLKGELVLKHHLGSAAALNEHPPLFIEVKKDSLIPYFIESITARNESEVLVKLEGIDTPEAARRLSRKNVYLTEEVFNSLTDIAAPISLVGYTIVENKKNLGEVVEVIEQPHQLLCKIIMQEKEVLIPLHEQSLLEIDRRKHLIYVQLPDGLLEVFLGK